MNRANKVGRIASTEQDTRGQQLWIVVNQGVAGADGGPGGAAEGKIQRGAEAGDKQV